LKASEITDATKDVLLHEVPRVSEILVYLVSPQQSATIGNVQSSKEEREEEHDEREEEEHKHEHKKRE